MTCIAYKQGRKKAYICLAEEPEQFWTKRAYNAPDCPNEEQHAACPRGYSAWFAWAARMGRTHRQTRCPGCQLLAIWVPIVRRGPRKPKTLGPGSGKPSKRLVSRGVLISH